MGRSNRRLDAAPWKPGALHAPGCTCEACAGLVRGSICQAGVLDPETGKLSSPAEALDQLAQRFDYVLAEADGSKRLPLKAHAAWEPVIPSGTATSPGSSALRGSASPSTKPSTAPSSFASVAAASPPTLPRPSASPKCSMPRCRRWNSTMPASCSTKSTRLPTQRWQIASRQLSTAPSSPAASSSRRHPGVLSASEARSRPRYAPRRGAGPWRCRHPTTRRHVPRPTGHRRGRAAATIRHPCP